MKIILSLIIAYLLGSVNPAYLICKQKGFDIRTKGTKNAGASNIKILLGWKYFFIVVVYDISKSVIAALISKYVFMVTYDWQIVAGCFAVLGHMYPFYLNFKGGKGFASYIGLAFYINWKLFLIIMAIGLIMSFITNWIVMATMTLSISMPTVAIVTGQSYISIIALLVISTIILVKHRDNYYRFLTKDETGINGKKTGINLLNK